MLVKTIAEHCFLDPLFGGNVNEKVKLERAVTFNEYIRPACLPNQFDPQTQYAIATGWNSTIASSDLLKRILKIHTYQECNMTFSANKHPINADRASLSVLDRTQLCVAHPSSKVRCFTNFFCRFCFLYEYFFFLIKFSY